ncbi:hypothetical protein GGI04_003821 [Coemansia thaxteri]|nr:hypothetical protein GGI04_003821 [Coemansia thaxteri]KAJ2465774.1 hypothetical protein GGI02_004591 [Coemansia sp. RSA 2322]KAJ2485862.1 hypothetical protein EV174_001477 [Coemansia sp. RSA 2320]
MPWKATVGLELHAQLAASQKLFSAASAKWNDPPNTNVNAVDAGLPGSMPRLNPDCVELAARAILSLNGRVQPMSYFDRKHYFYSDQPLGYQITQQQQPIGRGGHIELGPMDGLSYTKRVRIHQLQLEQDTAKSIHGMYAGHTLIDLNRAGVGLIEIVTEPDMETADEAIRFIRKIQALLRHVGVSSCNMEDGSLRCDVNVSVYHSTESRLSGTRCELKNLNSLKTIRGAIDAEVLRQTELIASGNVVQQETRGFDAQSGKTVLARSKETAPDYRYMPEPDLPSVHITEDWVELVRSSLPELPEAMISRVVQQYGLVREDVVTMLGEPGCIKFFEQVAKGRDPKRVAAWITSEVFGQLSYRAQRLSECTLSVQQFAGLFDAMSRKSITSAQAKQLLIEFMNGSAHTADELIKAHGWEVMDDLEQIRDLGVQLLAKHPKEAAEYRAGRQRRLNFFVSQIVAATKGQARPQDVSRIVKELLDARNE